MDSLLYMQGYHSPYYKDSHKKFRAICRKFVEEELKPNADAWIKAGAYPQQLHERAYALGLGGLLYPTEYGGTRPADYDAFYELVLADELSPREALALVYELKGIVG